MLTQHDNTQLVKMIASYGAKEVLKAMAVICDDLSKEESSPMDKRQKLSSAASQIRWCSEGVQA